MKFTKWSPKISKIWGNSFSGSWFILKWLILTSIHLSISSFVVKALERPTPAMLMEERRKLTRTMRSRNTASKKYNQVQPRWHLSLQRTEAHELFSCVFLFMWFGWLPSLKTCADVKVYPDFHFDSGVIPPWTKIHALSKPGCDGRTDCSWCTFLVSDTEERLQLIFDTKWDPLWAICSLWWEGAENQEILTLEFPVQNRRIRSPSEPNYWSTRCPRTNGTHTS